VEDAVRDCVRAGAATADVGGSLGTAAAGDAVCQRLRLP
jgi:isocitrate/isopropylmalate dehydrogenase